MDLVLTGRNVGGETLFTNPATRKLWASHFDNEQWVCTFKVIASLDDKQRLFAYINGPLVDATLAAFENNGVEFANTADIYYYFKDKLARYIWVDPVEGKEHVRVYDFSDRSVPVDLLTKFVNDWILWMEQHQPSFVPPDAEAYKTQKRFGKGFKSMKDVSFHDKTNQ